MIQAIDITKRFGDKTAADNISFTVPSGTIAGFIGPNGAGKTTTIHMMTGILKPDGGEFLLNDINIEKNPVQAKRQFGLIPDSPDLFLRLTGLEYINFMADIYRIDPEVRKERTDLLAKQFNMESDLSNRMQDYSHGMRQKTLIIAALVCDPSIWILDEPMTGLDPESSYILKEKMKEHAAKGNTVFFSTHVLEVAERLCDMIILIVKGKIVYSGSLAELKEIHGKDRDLEEIFLEVIGNA